MLLHGLFYIKKDLVTEKQDAMDVYINQSKLKSRMILCGALLVLGGALIVFTLVYSLINFELLPMLAILFGASFLVMSMAYTIKANRVHDVDTPVLTISEKGFYDSRLFKKPIV